ncbi:hypothetical protein HUU51_05590 [Candidatus Gracilibacteria bacterium]|nr:hypothetical protein [Candidatus Gracilibacteria bacterium]
MNTNTIKLNEKTSQKFSSFQLEKFINSEDFEDIVFGYQINKGKTGKTTSFNSFKEELGL